MLAAKHYYSPYPTMADLDGPLGGLPLGQTQSLWDRVQSATGLTLAQRAKRVGYAIPKAPLSWKPFQDLWRVMVNVDVMALELGRAYQSLSWQLAYGAIDCDELNLYNQAALRHYDVQSKLARLLRMSPKNVVPGSVPFPALFIGRGQIGGKTGELLCTPGQKVTKDQVTPQAGCPGVLPPDTPGSGFQAAPAVAWAIGASFVLVVGVVTVGDVWDRQELAQIESISAAAEQAATYTSARNEAVKELAKACMDKSPQKDPSRCIDEASEALKDPGTVFDRAIGQIAKVGGLPWYAWAGIGVGLLATGAAVAISMRKR